VGSDAKRLNASREGTGDDFERTHRQVFLLHDRGARGTLLMAGQGQRLNAIYEVSQGGPRIKRRQLEERPNKGKGRARSK